jgi:hypothetical protein
VPTRQQFAARGAPVPEEGLDSASIGRELEAIQARLEGVAGWLDLTGELLHRDEPLLPLDRVQPKDDVEPGHLKDGRDLAVGAGDAELEPRAVGTAAGEEERGQAG